jgi:hypothetical protein
MRFAQESAALPLDVRKAFGLPEKMYFDCGLRPILSGRSP